MTSVVLISKGQLCPTSSGQLDSDRMLHELDIFSNFKLNSDCRTCNHVCTMLTIVLNEEKIKLLVINDPLKSCFAL